MAHRSLIRALLLCCLLSILGGVALAQPAPSGPIDYRALSSDFSIDNTGIVSVGTLVNKTLTNPTVNGGSLNNIVTLTTTGAVTIGTTLTSSNRSGRVAFNSFIADTTKAWFTGGGWGFGVQPSTTSATLDIVPALTVQRVTNYTGAMPPGNNPSALWVVNTVGSGMSGGLENAFISQLNINATAGVFTSGTISCFKNVGGTVSVPGTAGVVCLNVNSQDKSGERSALAGSNVVLEPDLWASGPDDAFVRHGIDMVMGEISASPDGPTTFTTAGLRVRGREYKVQSSGQIQAPTYATVGSKVTAVSELGTGLVGTFGTAWLSDQANTASFSATPATQTKLTAAAATTGATTLQVTVSSTIPSYLWPGSVVSGPGLAANTHVSSQSYDGNVTTTITLDKPTTGNTASGSTLTFTHNIQVGFLAGAGIVGYAFQGPGFTVDPVGNLIALTASSPQILIKGTQMGIPGAGLSGGNDSAAINAYLDTITSGSNGMIFMPNGTTTFSGITHGPSTPLHWLVDGTVGNGGVVSQVGRPNKGDLVENFTAGTKQFFVPSAAPDMYGVLRVDYTFATGGGNGTSGVIATPIRVNAQDYAAAVTSMWGVHVAMDSYATGATWPQNVGVSSTVIKHGFAWLAGMHITATDVQNLASTTGGTLLGMEIGYHTNAADNSANANMFGGFGTREAIHLSMTAQAGGTFPAVHAAAIHVDGDANSITEILLSAGVGLQGYQGLDVRAAVVPSGYTDPYAAVRMADTQAIDFLGGTALNSNAGRYLQHTSSGTARLRYMNATTEEWSVSDAGVVTAAGGLTGVATNSNAAAGIVGEFPSSSTLITATSVTSGTPVNLTSISLGAGDWDVTATAGFAPAGTTQPTLFAAGISTVSATLPSPASGASNQLAANFGTGQQAGIPVPPFRISVSTTTTVFLVAQSNFTVSTMTAGGSIRARRVR